MSEEQAPPLPVSTALAEASADSLSELLSRDPEGYSRRDRDQIIEALRAQRGRQQAALAAGKAPKAVAGPKVPVTQKVSASAEDLGI